MSRPPTVPDLPAPTWRGRRSTWSSWAPRVEGAEAIGALRDVLGLATAIEHVAGAAEVVERLGSLAPPPTPAAELPVPASVESREHSGAAMGSGLDEIAGELARVAHDLNNPLAVIAGNAQLALEMAGALGTDETIVESLQAIDGAAAQLQVLFAEIGALRQIVDREREKGGPV